MPYELYKLIKNVRGPTLQYIHRKGAKEPLQWAHPRLFLHELGTAKAIDGDG